jgi:predicted RecA/RadA family phage recombinase
MAINRVYEDANSIPLTVGVGVVSGDPVQVGDLVGVAVTDRGAGGNIATQATVALKGAWRVEVTADDGAITEGEKIYIDGAGDLSNTAAGGKLFGHALEALGNGETDEIVVRLVQS